MHHLGRNLKKKQNKTKSFYFHSHILNLLDKGTARLHESIIVGVLCVCPTVFHPWSFPGARFGLLISVGSRGLQDVLGSGEFFSICTLRVQMTFSLCRWACFLQCSVYTLKIMLCCVLFSTAEIILDTRLPFMKELEYGKIRAGIKSLVYQHHSPKSTSYKFSRTYFLVACQVQNLPRHLVHKFS